MRLRAAVESMPDHAKRAMLDGIAGNKIIVGAYTDPRSGGICPMLAAHRHGGRVTMLAFARSWDAFTRTKRPRRATQREVRTLEHLLMASLGETSEFAAAIADYQRKRRTYPDFRVGRLSEPRRSGPRAAAGAAARTAS